RLGHSREQEANPTDVGNRLLFRVIWTVAVPPHQRNRYGRRDEGLARFEPVSPCRPSSNLLDVPGASTGNHGWASPCESSSPEEPATSARPSFPCCWTRGTASASSMPSASAATVYSPAARTAS